MFDFDSLICSGVVVSNVSPSVFSVFGSGACGFLFALSDGTWAYTEDYISDVNIADNPYDAVHQSLAKS